MLCGQSSGAVRSGKKLLLEGGEFAGARTQLICRLAGEGRGGKNWLRYRSLRHNWEELDHLTFKNNVCVLMNTY